MSGRQAPTLTRACPPHEIHCRCTHWHSCYPCTRLDQKPGHAPRSDRASHINEDLTNIVLAGGPSVAIGLGGVAVVAAAGLAVANNNNGTSEGTMSANGATPTTSSSAASPPQACVCPLHTLSHWPRPCCCFQLVMGRTNGRYMVMCRTRRCQQRLTRRRQLSGSRSGGRASLECANACFLLERRGGKARDSFLLICKQESAAFGRPCVLVTAVTGSSQISIRMLAVVN